MFHTNIYGPLDGEWLYYNLPLEVLTQRKLCSRLYSIEIEFYSNKQKIVFEPSFEGLRGNVRTPSIARKARG